MPICSDCGKPFTFRGAVTLRCYQCSLERSRRIARAHRVVGEAVRAGTLIPEPCEVCSSSTRTDAHHDDYSKPLEVRWLCPTHHRRLHADLTRERREVAV